ncbi:hypothetical protein H9P43_004539 [Blastocladiella emersonii ATCC 22665]|nr:hypothetical protein H9P43_004539 [Blastocladiella emersonii ATCC 22665]
MSPSTPPPSASLAADRPLADRVHREHSPVLQFGRIAISNAPPKAVSSAAVTLPPSARHYFAADSTPSTTAHPSNGARPVPPRGASASPAPAPASSAPGGGGGGGKKKKSGRGGKRGSTGPVAAPSTPSVVAAAAAAPAAEENAVPEPASPSSSVGSAGIAAAAAAAAKAKRRVSRITESTSVSFPHTLDSVLASSATPLDLQFGTIEPAVSPASAPSPSSPAHAPAADVSASPSPVSASPIFSSAHAPPKSDAEPAAPATGADVATKPPHLYPHQQQQQHPQYYPPHQQQQQQQQQPQYGYLGGAPPQYPYQPQQPQQQNQQSPNPNQQQQQQQHFPYQQPQQPPAHPHHPQQQQHMHGPPPPGQQHRSPGHSNGDQFRGSPNVNGAGPNGAQAPPGSATSAGPPPGAFSSGAPTSGPALPHQAMVAMPPGLHHPGGEVPVFIPWEGAPQYYYAGYYPAPTAGPPHLAQQQPQQGTSRLPSQFMQQIQVQPVPMPYYAPMMPMGPMPPQGGAPTAGVPVSSAGPAQPGPPGLTAPVTAAGPSSVPTAPATVVLPGGLVPMVPGPPPGPGAPMHHPVPPLPMGAGPPPLPVAVPAMPLGAPPGAAGGAAAAILAPRASKAIKITRRDLPNVAVDIKDLASQAKSSSSSNLFDDRSSNLSTGSGSTPIPGHHAHGLHHHHHHHAAAALDDSSSSSDSASPVADEPATPAPKEPELSASEIARAQLSAAKVTRAILIRKPGERATPSPTVAAPAAAVAEVPAAKPVSPTRARGRSPSPAPKAAPAVAPVQRGRSKSPAPAPVTAAPKARSPSPARPVSPVRSRSASPAKVASSPAPISVADSAAEVESEPEADDDEVVVRSGPSSEVGAADEDEEEEAEESMAAKSPEVEVTASPAPASDAEDEETEVAPAADSLHHDGDAEEDHTVGSDHDDEHDHEQEHETEVVSAPADDTSADRDADGVYRYPKERLLQLFSLDIPLPLNANLAPFADRPRGGAGVSDRGGRGGSSRGAHRGPPSRTGSANFGPGSMSQGPPPPGLSTTSYGFGGPGPIKRAAPLPPGAAAAAAIAAANASGSDRRGGSGRGDARRGTGPGPRDRGDRGDRDFHHGAAPPPQDYRSGGPAASVMERERSEQGGSRRGDRRGSRRGGDRGGQKEAKEHHKDPHGARGVALLPEDLKPLEKSSSAWVPDSLVAKVGDAAAAGVAEEESPEEVYLRKIGKQTRGLLNKLSPENYEKLEQRFVEPLESAAALKLVTSLIVRKSFDEPKYASLYARLTLYMNKFMKPLKGQPDDDLEVAHRIRKQTRTHVVSACQEQFLARPKWAHLAKGSISEEQFEEVVKIKSKVLGNMRFISELFNYGIISKRVIASILGVLLSNAETPAEEDLECLIVLATNAGRALTVQLREDLNTFFDTIRSIAENAELIPRLKFALLDLIALKENNWVKPSGPKPTPAAANAAATSVLRRPDRGGNNSAAASNPGGWTTKEGPGGSSSSAGSRRGNNNNNNPPGPPSRGASFREDSSRGASSSGGARSGGSATPRGSVSRATGSSALGGGKSGASSRGNAFAALAMHDDTHSHGGDTDDDRTPSVPSPVKPAATGRGGKGGKAAAAAVVPPTAARTTSISGPAHVHLTPAQAVEKAERAVKDFLVNLDADELASVLATKFPAAGDALPAAIARAVDLILERKAVQAAAFGRALAAAVREHKTDAALVVRGITESVTFAEYEDMKIDIPQLDTLARAMVKEVAPALAPAQLRAVLDTAGGLKLE